MKIVISIGGSVLMPDVDSEGVRKYAEVIQKLASGNDVKVVVGGGKVSREYVGVARKLGASEGHCDNVGIAITRANALLLIAGLEDAYPFVPECVEAAAMQDGLVVMGGTEMSHTTDAVAAMLAEYWGADLLVVATNVDGVYEEDPKKNPKAKRFEKIGVDKLVEIAAKGERKAASPGVVDILAAKLIKRAGIKTLIVDGRDAQNIEKAVSGKVIGTVVE